MLDELTAFLEVRTTTHLVAIVVAVLSVVAAVIVHLVHFSQAARKKQYPGESLHDAIGPWMSKARRAYVDEKFAGKKK